MGGGLIQLVLKGRDNIYLNSNPKLTFFKKVFYKFSPFTLFSKSINVLKNTTFNSNTSCLIPKNGDLIDDIHIEATLPKLDGKFKFDNKYEELYNLYTKNNYTVTDNFDNLKENLNNLSNISKNEYNLLESDDHIFNKTKNIFFRQLYATKSCSYASNYLEVSIGEDISSIFTPNKSVVKLISSGSPELNGNYLVHSLIDDDQTLQLYLYDTFNLKGNDLTSISGANVDVYINEDKEFNFIDNSLIKNRLYNIRLDSSSFTISEYELINNRLRLTLNSNPIGTLGSNSIIYITNNDTFQGGYMGNSLGCFNQPAELFNGTTNNFDLDDKIITFIPVGTDQFEFFVENSGYDWGAVNFAAEPNASQWLGVTDDSSLLVAFGGAQTFSYYGISYTEIYINSNGSLTFDTGNTEFNETWSNHFTNALPRISFFFDDLDPSSGGEIWTFSDNATYVSFAFHNVPEFVFPPNSNNVIVTLYFSSGVITMDFGVVDLNDCIVGLANGISEPTDLYSPGLDFTSYEVANIYEVYLDSNNRNGEYNILSSAVDTGSVYILDSNYNKYNYVKYDQPSSDAIYEAPTQVFSGTGADAFDLQNTTLSFERQSATEYKVSSTSTSWTTFMSAGWTQWVAGDDDTTNIPFGGVDVLTYYGTAGINSVNLNSNGNLTFVTGDTNYAESYTQHFALKRLSFLFNDLNPAAGGQIWYKLTSTEYFQAAFIDVQEYGTTNVVNCIVTIYYNNNATASLQNKITFQYGTVNILDGIVGISNATIPTDISNPGIDISSNTQDDGVLTYEIDSTLTYTYLQEYNKSSLKNIDTFEIVPITDVGTDNFSNVLQVKFNSHMASDFTINSDKIYIDGLYSFIYDGFYMVKTSHINDYLELYLEDNKNGDSNNMIKFYEDNYNYKSQNVVVSSTFEFNYNLGHYEKIITAGEVTNISITDDIAGQITITAGGNTLLSKANFPVNQIIEIKNTSEFDGFYAVKTAGTDTVVVLHNLTSAGTGKTNLVNDTDVVLVIYPNAVINYKTSDPNSKIYNVETSSVKYLDYMKFSDVSLNLTDTFVVSTNILTITFSGDITSYFVVGDNIFIEGNDVTTFDGIHSITGVSGSTITINLTTSDITVNDYRACVYYTCYNQINNFKLDFYESVSDFNFNETADNVSSIIFNSNIYKDFIKNKTIIMLEGYDADGELISGRNKFYLVKKVENFETDSSDASKILLLHDDPSNTYGDFIKQFVDSIKVYIVNSLCAKYTVGKQLFAVNDNNSYFFNNLSDMLTQSKRFYLKYVDKWSNLSSNKDSTSLIFTDPNSELYTEYFNFVDDINTTSVNAQSNLLFMNNYFSQYLFFYLKYQSANNNKLITPKSFINLFYDILYNNLLLNENMKYIYYFYDLYNRENYFSNDSLLNFPIDRYGTKYMYIDFGTDTQLLDVNNELKLEYFYNLKDNTKEYSVSNLNGIFKLEETVIQNNNNYGVYKMANTNVNKEKIINSNHENDFHYEIKLDDNSFSEDVISYEVVDRVETFDDFRIGDIELISNTTEIDISTSTVLSPLSYTTLKQAQNCIDGNKDSYWIEENEDDLILNFSPEVKPQYMRFRTADKVEKDPVSWDVYGVNETTSVDDIVNYQLVTTSSTTQDRMNIGTKTNEYTITNITQAIPAVVTVTDATGLSTGDQIKITGVFGMEAINDADYYISVAGNNLTLYEDAGLGIDFDSSVLDPYTGEGTVDNVNLSSITEMSFSVIPSIIGIVDNNITISNISQANPAIVTVSNGGIFTSGDKIKITNVAGMTEVNNNTYYIDAIGGDDLALYTDISLASSVNSSSFTAYSSGGNVSYMNYIQVEASSGNALNNTTFSVGKVVRILNADNFNGYYTVAVEGDGTVVILNALNDIFEYTFNLNLVDYVKQPEDKTVTTTTNLEVYGDATDQNITITATTSETTQDVYTLTTTNNKYGAGLGTPTVTQLELKVISPGIIEILADDTDALIEGKGFTTGNIVKITDYDGDYNGYYLISTTGIEGMYDYNGKSLLYVYGLSSRFYDTNSPGAKISKTATIECFNNNEVVNWELIARYNNESIPFERNTFTKYFYMNTSREYTYLKFANFSPRGYTTNHDTAYLKLVFNSSITLKLNTDIFRLYSEQFSKLNGYYTFNSLHTTNNINDTIYFNLLKREEYVVVSNITQADPAVVTIENGYILNDGLKVRFANLRTPVSGSSLGMIQLEYYVYPIYYYIKKVTDTTYQLYTDINLTTKIDSSGYTAYQNWNNVVNETNYSQGAKPIMIYCKYENGEGEDLQFINSESYAENKKIRLTPSYTLNYISDKLYGPYNIPVSIIDKKLNNDLVLSSEKDLGDFEESSIIFGSSVTNNQDYKTLFNAVSLDSSSSNEYTFIETDSTNTLQINFSSDITSYFSKDDIIYIEGYSDAMYDGEYTIKTVNFKNIIIEYDSTVDNQSDDLNAKIYKSNLKPEIFLRVFSNPYLNDFKQMLIKPITFDEKDVTQINTVPVSSSEIKPYDIKLHEKMANNKINLVNYIDNTKTNKSCYVINDKTQNPVLFKSRIISYTIKTV